MTRTGRKNRAGKSVGQKLSTVLVELFGFDSRCSHEKEAEGKQGEGQEEAAEFDSLPMLTRRKDVREQD